MMTLRVDKQPRIIFLTVISKEKYYNNKKKKEEFHACNISFRSRLLEIYNKIHKMSNVLGYFSTVEWMYSNEKWNGLMRKLTSEDHELFFSDMKGFFQVILISRIFKAILDSASIETYRIFLIITWSVISKLCFSIRVTLIRVTSVCHVSTRKDPTFVTSMKLRQFELCKAENTSANK
ncbi:fatty acyl-CoA reductase wat-like isoform X1 [Vespula squamosa]|uniref:Fatty acyl-CoA reductase wat-like isoform X1 n=1 Tax=Vespula squamosa TaxID=30214 RepID=A0ABD2C946_VESSQ